MPTAGAADTRCRCLCCVRGRAQLPSLLPFRQQVSCAVPVPRIHSCRVHCAVSILPPLPHCEGASLLSRLAAEALRASSRLGPQGVPMYNAPCEARFCRSTPMTHGGGTLPDGRTTVWRVRKYPCRRRLPAGPTETAAAAARISREQIAYRSNTAAAGCCTALLARPRRGPGGLPTEKDAIDARV